MSLISPQPHIARVIRTCEAPPGLTFSLVEDSERRLWIVEACPTGQQFWTMAQAEQLPQGVRSGPALREILRIGRQMELAQRRQPVSRSSSARKSRTRQRNTSVVASRS
jgi:hypothetical protein